MLYFSTISRILGSHSFPGYEDKKAEIRACGQSAVHAFAKVLCAAAIDPSAEVRKAAISAIKQVMKCDIIILVIH